MLIVHLLDSLLRQELLDSQKGLAVLLLQEILEVLQALLLLGFPSLPEAHPCRPVPGVLILQAALVFLPHLQGMKSLSTVSK
jgi:hypothetical protein